tara:strand:+ start:2301 stop:3494 length:1194 start_codon:yes stop_codon:yes gene_type:complete
MKKLDFKNINEKLTEDFDLPPVGIEDVDRSIFNLFDKDINFEVVNNKQLTKVPVVFAAGERFALTRRKNPIRDNNNTLILPIVSIVRGEIDFSTSLGGRGSAISVPDQTNYVIKKRLSAEDRDYQNIRNKFSLLNQDNVSTRGHLKGDLISPGNEAVLGTIASRRQGNAIKFRKSGAQINLGSNSALGDNIFEIIYVPYPRQFAIKYTVTFWTQYIGQMNQIQETYLSRFPAQSKEFILKTEHGYEFVAASSQSFSSDTNFTEYTNSERLIKSSVTITVVGYVINPQHPGIANHIRSSFSAPNIEFGYNNANSHVVVRENIDDRNLNKFILNDIENVEEITNELQRGNSSEELQTEIINPFTGEKEVGFSKILTRNQRSGETVASNLIVKKIETQYE